MRSVSGQHFTFTWSPGNGSDWDPGQAWPGDAYVDYVGQSLYDSLWGRPTSDAAGDLEQPQDGKWGLDWQASFAGAHRKKLAYPEWGLSRPRRASTTAVAATTPYFIQQLPPWLRNHNVAYEIYFNRDHSPNVHRINDGTSDSYNFRNAARAYRATFGATSGGGTVVTPRPKPKPKPSAKVRNTLLFSAEGDRDHARKLGGKRVASKRAVFLRPSRAAVGVNYFLDGRRIRYESDAPFDFAGTKRGGNAKMFRFGKLSKGSHSLVAVIDWEGGGRKVVTAKFRR